MTSENKTILDFKDYPDIDLRGFVEWFKKKYFKQVTLNNDTDWYLDKYDVETWFHEDIENNQFSLELKLVDVTDHPLNPELDRMITEALGKINRNNIDVDEISEDLNLEDIPEKDRSDQVKFTRTYY